MDASTRIAGEELVLAPERAALWRTRGMLLVADLHFAKAATFRAGGVFVPSGTTGETLVRLDALIARLAPSSIVFLGDFLHAAEGRNVEMFSVLAEWRRKHAAIGMTLVRGNHDLRAGDPPPEVGITCIDGPHPAGPFVLAHHPVADTRGYVLAGHVHPCAVLTGRGGERLRLPSFHFGAGAGILPAFGEFTGSAKVPAVEGDEVWVVADEEVTRVR